MQRPIIGILTIVDDELTTSIKNTYINAIEKSGGVPLLLPYVKDTETIKTFVNICDGILFTGGVDINPERYGDEKKETCGTIQMYRDELEFNVFRVLYPTLKPILAICRGAQFINVALGGTLYQDIPSEMDTNILHRQEEPRNAHSHTIKITEGTPLSNLLSTTSIRINSFHHQAIKKLGDKLEVMARADDGIIEAVYSRENRYVRAYQWHPELLFETDEGSRAIFKDFIDACKKTKFK